MYKFYKLRTAGTSCGNVFVAETIGTYSFAPRSSSALTGPPANCYTTNSRCVTMGAPAFVSATPVVVTRPRHSVHLPSVVTATATTSSTNTSNSTSTSALTTTATKVTSRRTFLRLAAAVSALRLLPFPSPLSAAAASTSSAYDLSPLKNGKPYPLSGLRGKVTLFVNVASYCALTPQYKGLVALHDKYESSGFEVVAAPSNQFGSQEPDSNETICANVRSKFGAHFLILDKLAVNEDPPQGPVDPLYRFLRDTAAERTGDPIAWNFEKFLVDRDGKVLRRYGPGLYPTALDSDINFALDNPGKTLPLHPKSAGLMDE